MSRRPKRGRVDLHFKQIPTILSDEYEPKATLHFMPNGRVILPSPSLLRRNATEAAEIPVPSKHLYPSKSKDHNHTNEERPKSVLDRSLAFRYGPKLSNEIDHMMLIQKPVIIYMQQKRNQKP
jgi:hypothetical protein